MRDPRKRPNAATYTKPKPDSEAPSIVYDLRFIFVLFIWSDLQPIDDVDDVKMLSYNDHERCNSIFDKGYCTSNSRNQISKVE